MKIIKNNWPLLIILILALLLRLPLLNSSFWLDEAAQALESIRPLNQQLDIIADFQPPLLHLITHFALKISTQEYWLRIVGALTPGLITIWATYQIGNKLFSKKLAFLASFFLSISSFHIFFSQELRPYSLPAMWASLSWLILLKEKKSKSIKKKIFYFKKEFLLFSLFSLLGLYSSYLYPFLLFSQVIYLLISKREIFFPLLLQLAAAFILYLPWTPSFFAQLNTGQKLRQELPNWEKVVSIPQLKSLLLVLSKFLFGVIDLQFNAKFLSISLIVLLLIFLLITYRFYPTEKKNAFDWLNIQIKQLSKKRNKKKFSLLLPILIWLFLPLITAWLVSFFVPVLRPKRVLYLMPAFYLFLAYLIISGFETKIKEKITKINAFLLLLIILTLQIYSTYQYYFDKNYQREDWRSLYQNINSRFSLQETILVFSFPDAFAPWKWYDQSKYPFYSTGKHYIADVENLTQDLKIITDYNFVLLFDYLRNLTDPNEQLNKEIESFGYQGIGVIDYPNIGFVRIYSKKNITLSDFRRELDPSSKLLFN
ncbi:MAG: glycosyltransferase family 39 protein [Candidatus Woesebacteria bacterium]